MSNVADECNEKNQDIGMPDDDKLDLSNAKCRHICTQEFGRKYIKVRDHCHRTDKFCGAAHDRCNMNYCQTGCTCYCLYIQRIGFSF